MPSTWLIVGASRGIGLEFARQLLARGENVIATVRDQFKAGDLWQLSGSTARPGALRIELCDVTVEESIENFVAHIKTSPALSSIEYVIVNAGVLRYPNRATEISFQEFSYHLATNTIGPIITAQKLLDTRIPIGTVVFMSSDSGSATNFRDFEDGFGAYAASKAALNQMLRHMAAELKRKHSGTTILALHPGEVATDMANITVEWDIEGILTAEESVSAMLKVIPTKTVQQSGTFWTWEGKEHPW